MENLVKIGLVRSIGISNFNSEQVTRLLANCEIKPVNNQVNISTVYLSMLWIILPCYRLKFHRKLIKNN